MTTHTTSMLMTTGSVMVNAKVDRYGHAEVLEPNHLNTSLFLQPIRYGHYNQLLGYHMVSKVYIPVCHDLLSNRKCHVNMVQHVIAPNLHFVVHIGQYVNMSVNM